MQTVKAYSFKQNISQRLVAVTEHRRRSGDDINELKAALSYEMETIPTSLFDADTNFMNKADKPDLINKLVSLIPAGSSAIQYNPPDEACYVLDGGNLLYQVKWPAKLK